MLEFYQAYATYEDLMALTEELFRHLSMTILGTLKFPYGEWEIDLAPAWRRVTLKEAICGVVGCSPDALDDERSLAQIGQAVGISESLAPGRLLVEIFERAVEPHLVQPTFVTSYPIVVSPLARRNDRDPSTVDRFELYIAGREIGRASCRERV